MVSQMQPWLSAGKSYKTKHFDELSVEELRQDFVWKDEILLSRSSGLVDFEVFYEDFLFRNLPDGYKVLLLDSSGLTGKKCHALDVSEIGNFLDSASVAISPCLFHENFKKKKLLNYVLAFILDIDKLRPLDLVEFLNRIDAGRILAPTFISNSGSGAHFIYLLDEPFSVRTTTHAGNYAIAGEIYQKLYDAIIRDEGYENAQRHWIGQDYRVVGSKTKLGQRCKVYRYGELYSIDFLIDKFKIKTKKKTKQIATPKQRTYARSIARDLKIPEPDFDSFDETYSFIKSHKDEAYKVRAARREKRKQAEEKRKKKGKAKKPKTWYQNTYNRVRDYAVVGNRFDALKALTIIGHKEGISYEKFNIDITRLVEEWKEKNWGGDEFNEKNVEAIYRLWDNAEKYHNTSAKKLEEWLGFDFRRIPQKKNGRTKEEHLNQVMNPIRNAMYPDGSWRGGSYKKQKEIKEWREKNPDGTKYRCAKETGISKKTVAKWWDENNTEKIWYIMPGAEKGETISVVKEEAFKYVAKLEKEGYVVRVLNEDKK